MGPVAIGSDRFEGQVFGRHRLVRLLAEGGMANVYLARLEGAHGFHKTVAVKVIHPHLAEDRRLLSMFLDEARVAVQIQHTNVCSILDFGVHEGVPYIVMEHLDGSPLSGLLRRAWDGGGLDAPLAARIVAEAARGLHAAHETRSDEGRLLKVVHRDVSPQNIFVLHEGAVRVLDFGIARMRGRLAQTGVGELKGKVAYMSPEQLGEGEVDRRTDVWSLGVVLWEATLGRRLFLGAEFAQSVDNVLSAPIPRPSEVAAGYPAALEAAVMGALERDPARRTGSAARLADELEAFLYGTGEPCGAAQVAAAMERWFGVADDEPSEETTQSGPIGPLGVGFDGTESIDMSLHAAVGEAAEPPGSPAPGPAARTTGERARPAAGMALEPAARPRPRRRRRLPVVSLAAAAVLLLAAAVVARHVTRGAGEGGAPAAVRAPSPPAAVVDGRRGDAEGAPGEDESWQIVEGAVDGAPGQAAAPGDGGEPDDLDEARIAALDASPSLEPTSPPPRPAGPPPRPRPGSKAPAAQGTLNLLAIPNATVTWRGRPLGRTPLVERPMPPGTHTLVLRPVAGGEPETVTVVIRPGETTRATVRLR